MGFVSLKKKLILRLGSDEKGNRDDMVGLFYCLNDENCFSNIYIHAYMYTYTYV